MSNIKLNSIFKTACIASDHAGFKLKEEIKNHLINKNVSIFDAGPYDNHSVDYPDYAKKLGNRIKQKKSQVGILVCGSGTGMAISANKIKSIRAAVCYNIKSTRLSRQHNNANIIAIGSRLTKKKFPDVGVMCDVALYPYTSHGHDGIIINKKIDNDETIKVLTQQAINHAKMGCDIVAPSDMMDGRVGVIRKALNKNNYQDVNILSYAVKYASNFYGPFRDAVGSKSRLKQNKKTYQMDYRNNSEIYREVGFDLKEGADIILVKPGMIYLDVIQKIKKTFNVPVIAYQVSGEYSMLKNAILKKILNEDSIIESLVSFKRAPALLKLSLIHI